MPFGDSVTNPTSWSTSTSVAAGSNGVWVTALARQNGLCLVRSCRVEHIRQMDSWRTVVKRFSDMPRSNKLRLETIVAQASTYFSDKISSRVETKETIELWGTPSPYPLGICIPMPHTDTSRACASLRFGLSSFEVLLYFPPLLHKSSHCMSPGDKSFNF